MKELLFSITRKDFEFTAFRSGGPGGQNKNKVSSAIRCVHKESGAVGEGKEFRDQPQNKRNAFLRCVNSPKFQAYLKIRIAKETGEIARQNAVLEHKIRDLMQDKYLKIEYFESEIDKQAL
jgi:protein subunit release factor B